MFIKIVSSPFPIQELLLVTVFVKYYKKTFFFFKLGCLFCKNNVKYIENLVTLQTFTRGHIRNLFVKEAYKGKVKKEIFF